MTSQMSLEASLGSCLFAEEYPEYLSAPLGQIAKMMTNFTTFESMQESDGPTLPIRFEYVQDSGYSLRIHRCDDGRGLTVQFSRLNFAFRAIGRLLGLLKSGDIDSFENIQETSSFESLGIMIDCSRNAVPLVDTVHSFIRYIAMMGFNTLLLYMEDTYKVDGEPFFGYFRGAYSYDELKSIDDYAALYGIEVIPCIQTLGHLGQILQWPQFADYRDTSEVILANDDKTLQFIQRIIKAASAPFRTKRIHIGMDEANGLGTGKYKQLFGNKNPLNIFIEHLRAVTNVCREMGLQPMIWSDMIFSLSNNDPSLNGYYVDPTSLPELMSACDLVFWDYFHVTKAPYETKVNQHRQLGYEPWVAGGIWTWNRFYPCFPFTFTASNACLSACKEQGIKNVFATVWGDDANEYSLWSILPGLVFFAEHAFGTPTEETIRDAFEGITGESYKHWMLASKIDLLPGYELPNDDGVHFPPNTSKWLLWEDPVYSLYSAKSTESIDKHYSELSASLIRFNTPKSAISKCMTITYLISRILAQKVTLSSQIRFAYRNDHSLLKQICSETVPGLSNEVKRLHKTHRSVWHETYKPFGWEVLELRYGGLLLRFETLKDRISSFLKGEVDKLDEFEEEPQSISGEIFDFGKIWTPSRNLGTG